MPTLHSCLLLIVLLCYFQTANALNNALNNAPAPPAGRGGENRRKMLQQIASTSIVSSCISISFGSAPSKVNAAETIGKDSTCNDRNCIGVWDGLLADCPHSSSPMTKALFKGGAGCASSQDDTPGIFAEPWDYSETNNLDWEYQQKRLVTIMEGVSWQRNENVQLIFQEGRYTRALFTDAKTAEQTIGEFYFTPNDTTVQFRLASSSSNTASLLSTKNLDRSEALRKQLGYLKLPVLRNRKRALFFGESDLDNFGPGSASLGPPAEMRTGELEGIGRDVDPKLKIDFLQRFPTR